MRAMYTRNKMRAHAGLPPPPSRHRSDAAAIIFEFGIVYENVYSLSYLCEVAERKGEMRQEDALIHHVIVFSFSLDIPSCDDENALLSWNPKKDTKQTAVVGVSGLWDRLVKPLPLE